MEVEPYLKAGVTPLVLPVFSEPVKLRVPSLHLTDGIGLFKEGVGILLRLGSISGLPIREEGVVRILPGLCRPLDLVVGENDGEEGPKEPILQLRLAQISYEGSLPLVDLFDLNEGGFVIGSAPLGGRLNLVFKIVVREEISVLEGSQRYLHRNQTPVSLLCR